MPQKDVYLIPVRNPGGQVQWIWGYDGDFGAASTFPVIDLPPGIKDYTITFSVIDPLGQITFDNSMVTPPGGGSPYNNAFWAIAKGPGKSKKPGIETNNQLGAPAFKKGDTQLVIKDKNDGTPVVFEYQLNFKNSQASQPVTSIDPDLKNGGGNGSISYSALQTAEIAAGVAIAAALLARWGMSLQRRNGSARPITS